MRKYTAFIICFAGCLVSVHAQNNASPPVTKPVIVNAGDVYNPFVGKQSRIYNGIEHTGYPFKAKGHAYFMESEVKAGTITYDELDFADVPMLYDLLKDQVLVVHFNGFTKIGIVSEKVKEFTLREHHFVRLVADSLTAPLTLTGFYDQVYTGSFTVFVKRTKFIEETVREELERNFVQKDLYFIYKEGRYHSIKNYKGLLAFFGNRSKEVKQYLRKNKIKYRKGAETAIVKAAAYFDSLNK